MERRTFLGVVTGSLLAAPLAAQAQQAETPRIALLDASSMAARAPEWNAFRQGLGELGYVEGQNIAIASRSADGRYERLPSLAAELVRLKPDLIITAGAPAGLDAKQATTTIPIIIAAIGDPIPLKLVDSLARPGGNITGLTNVTIELAQKRVGLLKDMVPKVSRVAILWDEANPTAEFNVKETEAAAKAVGVNHRLLGVRCPDGFTTAFSTMHKEQVGALIIGPSPMFIGRRQRLVALAADNRLPTMWSLRGYTQAGGLMSYGPRNLSTRMRHGVREFTVAGAAQSSRCTGSVNVNVEPAPTWLLTQIF